MDLRLHAHHNHLEMKQEQEVGGNTIPFIPGIILDTAYLYTIRVCFIVNCCKRNYYR